jgi:hypothetical protein
MRRQHTLHRVVGHVCFVGIVHVDDHQKQQTQMGHSQGKNDRLECQVRLPIKELHCETVGVSLCNVAERSLKCRC